MYQQKEDEKSIITRIKFVYTHNYNNGLIQLNRTN